jgi:O-antigen ligase
MPATDRLDTAITYIILAFAAVMGFSRGGIHTLAVLLILLALVRFFMRPFAPPLEKEIKGALLIFFGALFISCVFSGDPAASFKFLFRTVVKFAPFFVVVAFLKDKEIPDKAAVLMTGSMIVGSAIAFWQVLHGAGRGAVKSALGVMDFAGLIGLLVPVLLVKGLDRDTDGRRRCLFLASALLALVALLYNGTRAVWVAMLIVAVAYIIIIIALNGRKSYKAAIAVGLMLCVAGLFFTTNSAMSTRLQTITDPNVKSNHERLVMWQYAFDIFTEHPLLGVGLATLPTLPMSPEEEKKLRDDPATYAYGHVHNNFLQMLAENGIVGGMAFAYLYFCILKTAVRRMRQPETRNWAMIAFLCTVAFLVHGFFDYTFTISTIMYSYWLIIGLAFANFRLAT